jgi:hypothetical protein
LLEPEFEEVLKKSKSSLPIYKLGLSCLPIYITGLDGDISIKIRGEEIVIEPSIDTKVSNEVIKNKTKF